MKLTWVRVDSDIAVNTKVVRLMKRRDGAKAFALWVFALGHAGRQGTDGHIDADILPFIHGTPALAQALVDVGLWEPAPDGWLIHDFGEYQQLSAVSAMKSTKRSAAGRKGNCGKWHEPGCECWKDGSPDA